MSAFLLHSKQSSLSPLLAHLKLPSGNTLPKENKDMLIQWGAAHVSTQDSSVHVLNGTEGLSNVSSKKTMQEILKYNGIPSMQSSQPTNKVSTIRRYFVPVFQQQILAMFRSRGKKVWLTQKLAPDVSDDFEEMEINRSLRETRKVIRYAIRSIYAVGLDFGGVLIGVSPDGQIKVIDINPAPKLNSRLAEKFANAFHQYSSQYKKTPSKSVMLGADPEFVLRNQVSGKIVLASRFFGKKGMVGCDQVWIRSDQSRRQLPLAELRPSPSRDPRQLTINLYKAMLLAERKINLGTIEWLAGGMPMKGYPIGGHIHFSQTSLNSHFLRALDNYLALPLMLLESKHSLNRRPKYGFLGDYREQFHGGFEYRTLPSWLVSPKITKGVLASAKLIAEHYNELSLLPTLFPAVQEAFYHGEKLKILTVVRTLWSRLEQLEGYKKYELYLNPYREILFNLEEWDEFADIRPAWRIPPFSSKKQVKSML